MHAIQSGRPDAWQAIGKIGGDPHKEPTLNHIRNVILETLHNRRDREGDEQGCRENEQRLNVGGGLSTEGQIAHHSIHRKRGREEQDP